MYESYRAREIQKRGARAHAGYMEHKRGGSNVSSLYGCIILVGYWCELRVGRGRRDVVYKGTLYSCGALQLMLLLLLLICCCCACCVYIYDVEIYREIYSLYIYFSDLFQGGWVYVART